MSQELTLSKDYKQFVAELKAKVLSSQLKAAVAVNSELVTLYWEIGRRIVEQQQANEWGNNVIGEIAKDLTRELGGMKGFSERNLYRMKLFYEFYSGYEKFSPQAVAKIPWGHNSLIIQKIKNVEQALWYVQKTIENNWARSVLQLQIESGLYERQAGKPKIDNFETSLPKPYSDLARDTLKDPYKFHFLDVGDEAHERAIEQGLVEHMTQFLLELGKGFAFVGKQYHLEVGGDDFYIDLLFYHLKLHCYFVLELKNGPFKPEYAGKLNFYLTAVDELVKTPEDNKSIGVVLCKDRNNLVAEYALRDLNKPMGVAQFETARMLPDELKSSLPTVEELEAELKDDEE